MSGSVKSNGSPDPEKDLHSQDAVSVDHDERIDTLNVLDATAAPVDPTSLWGRSLALSAALERKVGIEARGIQRVPEDQRNDRPSGNLWIWLAANCVLSTFGIGILGPSIFFLGLGDSMLTIFFTNIVTAALPAYMCVLSPIPLHISPPSTPVSLALPWAFGSLIRPVFASAVPASLASPSPLPVLPPLATFGPKLGLRQMTSARYSWGWHGAKIVALLNCIACVGWRCRRSETKRPQGPDRVALVVPSPPPPAVYPYSLSVGPAAGGAQREPRSGQLDAAGSPDAVAEAPSAPVCYVASGISSMKWTSTAGVATSLALFIAPSLALSSTLFPLRLAHTRYSAINTIAGAQTLRVVANDTISDAAGVVIVAIITLALGMLGYKYVHIYEKWSWIPTAITFFVVLGCAAKNLVNVPMGTGRAEASNVLSFMGVIFGFTIGWVSLASDYNVYQPASTPARTTFWWTYAGLIIPLVLVEWLGAAVMAAAFAEVNALYDDNGVATGAWAVAYNTDELGGLLGAVLHKVGGFGKFCMVLLVLSVVANNIINVYSMGLSISVVHVWLAKVPRLLWPIVITAIYIPIAIAGAHSFSTSLEDFMNVLGYWLSIFVVVVLLEHFIFRKGDWARYNAAETWNRSDRTPVGVAALVAFLFGALGTAMGMAQVWYIGKIGALVGGSANPFGGDIGFELAGTFAGIVYVPARYLELKYIEGDSKLVLLRSRIMYERRRVEDKTR
ncbi:Cytosine-purine permease [Mycena sanguinolenta]|uniref:Cytosine-purine permease n=1 Tax=Mycena sanguinolenta TaxID=230812 RepID=A0A8H7D0T9_9AGAR|nr:Cytosine-purine permease [Mycena sanguinolenta]